MRSFSASFSACVPLPAPGGPSRTTPIEEPFTVVLDELALDRGVAVLSVGDHADDRLLNHGVRVGSVAAADYPQPRGGREMALR
jgi:hypothetical protein